MKDVLLLFCIISLFAGMSSLSISYFIYNNNKKKSLKFFIGFNLSLFAIQNSVTLGLYLKYVINTGSFIISLSNVLDIIGTPFSSLFGLYFLNYLFGIKITNLKRNIYTLFFSFQLIGITIYYFIDKSFIFKLLGKTSLVVVIIYELFITLKSYKQLVNKDLKNAIKIFALTTIVFLPLMALELYNSNAHFFQNEELLKILTFPLYFLVINILSLIFVLKYFNTPAFIDNNKITNYFKEKYDITEKQGEIIELIIQGITYKQIAEKLFISPKTVDNHIQNIYKKLNVNSKIQLSNFVHSNEK